MADTVEMIEQALTWANMKLGSPAYAGRCLAFVEDCFERGNAIEVNGYPSAQEASESVAGQPIRQRATQQRIPADRPCWGVFNASHFEQSFPDLSV